MIVGIDLGTTHSLISVWKETQVTLIPNRFNKTLTPSVVSLDENQNILVGEEACKHPHSIAHFKRYMGADKMFRLSDETYRPEELSACVLKSLVQDAEAFLGEKVTRAVITVPAYFNNTQRKATWLAGELAGLTVERLINEPTAAALSYGLHQREVETKFLVFDLGGGTFDVSIVEIFSGIMEIRSSAGDNFLGGQDFTAVLEAALETKIKQEHGVCVEKNFAFQKAVEALKETLSNATEGEISIEQNGQTLTSSFTRSSFEKCVAPLITRLRLPLEKALSDARILHQELDSVILVGGATRMPCVQAEIGKLLGLFPLSTVHPDEAVAIGAGIQAALKGRHQDLKDVVVTDVSPFTLGTSVQQKYTQSGSRFLPIIERNTAIPVSRSEQVVTTVDQQKTMLIDIYQGESYLPEENIQIGSLKIPIPPAPKGQEAVDIRYSYDINGLLEVETTVLSTGQKKNLVIKNQDHSLSGEEVAASLEKLKKFKIHPRDKPENRQILNQLESLFTALKGEERDMIAEMLGFFNQALASQDDAHIEEAKDLVEGFLVESAFFEL